MLSARLASTLALASAVAMPAQAYQTLQTFNQAESRDRAGRLLVEASTISAIACNGPGENGGQYYIYRYLNRPGFRAIRPPEWARAIGGRDWSTFQQAVTAACGGAQGPVAGAGVSGQWRLVTTCTWVQPRWEANVALAQAADGSLTASTSNDPLNAEFVPPGGGTQWGSTMRSQVSGTQLNLVLHPKGWISVLEFTGTIRGNRIDGRIHHYTSDDCDFSLVR
jgi:hypothetical protein